MRVLGLDVGERRIGVALSDPSGWLASPLTTVTHRRRDVDLQTIRGMVQEHDVGQVVVGHPLSLDGTTGPQARRVERWAEHLRDRLEVPVVLWDERLSTAEAERLMHETGKRAERSRIDSLAATVILQSYLDAHPKTGGLSPGQLGPADLQGGE
jgi:putative Holliday junction resolvase